MRQVVVQAKKSASTREATDILVKIIYSNYMKSDLKLIDNKATQLNTEERNELLRLL